MTGTLLVVFIKYILSVLSISEKSETLELDEK